MTEHNLVSIETQSEYSVTTGRRETRIFVKMYVDAVHSGLLADIGDENWRTLCVIAAFMDERGECYPTQELIAHRLGVSLQTAAARIKSLLAYRWRGRPLVHATKGREDGSQRFDNTRYTVLPVSQLAIFSGEAEAMSSGADTGRSVYGSP
ncbi:helix-turn-helix domain-containing protein [Brevibacillus composti]|uniref:Helix-turn-helix domain-containing protein n=1 Tax=Brevibacillus composti TaxID=2796470 RepID=A0A7T5EIE4_9BACL|nr:helix-turn-helix domain-containing protein [Brevibacillus composti]QQE73164.1 helix-turn-helix domain-containing protein [Brevibacillus composti]QUO40243.1 helix-turn-helix domain-containing protein [Brevibacillus composti]